MISGNTRGHVQQAVRLHSSCVHLIDENRRPGRPALNVERSHARNWKKPEYQPALFALANAYLLVRNILIAGLFDANRIFLRLEICDAQLAALSRLWECSSVEKDERLVLPSHHNEGADVLPGLNECDQRRRGGNLDRQLVLLAAAAQGQLMRAGSDRREIDA